ncbi:GIY-YIG nuclease family protein [Candidatus Brachybacter algidus]|jgi:putative endonuclease|uniref:GIY-YIG nuclease family protein n=1 Tax=Candidatus Brachybacter algidus TaxID=2982024 RepID=UPI001B5BDB84|nr:GIY-YIG nuclease family protein [Saprospiraceae bacterium]MBP9126793.1 GIY-YIG nuclease family protein [Saprospiraceae bacterium]MBP9846891.1 GIY-YIG nuclease family protein [Saprospiraceae bacterium]
MHYLYILHSLSLDKFYVGSTSMSIEERLKKHLTNHDEFTSKAKDWVIVYYESYNTIQLACERIANKKVEI